MKAVLVDRIEPCILLVRGQRVMLDADLAALFGTTTKVFNQAVKRNLDRFPADFMLQLTAEEADAIRSQIATTSNPPAFMRSQTVTASKRNVLSPRKLSRDHPRNARPGGEHYQPGDHQPLTPGEFQHGRPAMK